MKRDNKQRLFELMEVINPDFNTGKEEWAIFRVSRGYGKCFATSVENNSVHVCDYALKYSDPGVLKFSLERAKEIVENDWRFDSTLGIVNSKGVQLGLGKYDKVWGRV
jgi:hypothetical protein